jgi:hypothetical protein
MGGMHGRIEFDHVRPHGLDEKSSLLLDLFQISGILGRKGRLNLMQSVGYMKLLTGLLKMLGNGLFLLLLLFGKVILLTLVMVCCCAVMRKVIALFRIPPGHRYRRHHFLVKSLLLLLLLLLRGIAKTVLTVLMGCSLLGMAYRQVRALTPKRRVLKLLDATLLLRRIIKT